MLEAFIYFHTQGHMRTNERIYTQMQTVMCVCACSFVCVCEHQLPGKTRNSIFFHVINGLFYLALFLLLRAIYLLVFLKLILVAFRLRKYI